MTGDRIRRLGTAPSERGRGGRARPRRKPRLPHVTSGGPPPLAHAHRPAPARAHGRLRERVVVDACALTSSWAGSPRCRPGSISRLASPTLARGERGAPGRLAGAFREVAVKGAHGGEGLETSGSAGPPYAQLGACFVREEGGVNRLRDVSKVVQPRNRRTSRGRTCRSLREDPPRSA